MSTTRSALRLAAISGLLAAALPVALAALPPPSDEAKAKAAAAAEKAAWAGKVQAYKQCNIENHLADTYRKTAQAAGKTVPAALPTPACADPGPFAAASATPRPIEASGAHSPPATATAPPSTTIPAAAIPASANK